MVGAGGVDKVGAGHAPAERTITCGAASDTPGGGSLRHWTIRIQTDVAKTAPHMTIPRRRPVAAGRAQRGIRPLPLRLARIDRRPQRAATGAGKYSADAARFGGELQRPRALRTEIAGERAHEHGDVLIGRAQIGGHRRFERPHELVASREAARAILLEALQDGGLELRGEILADLARRRDRLLRDVVEGRERPPSLERVGSRREHVEDDAEREDVDAAIGRRVLDLLGRKVADLAPHLEAAGRVFGAVAHHLGDAEVDDLRDPFERDENVLRRNVAMHEPDELAGRVAKLVRGMKTCGRLRGDPDRDRQRDLHAALFGRSQRAR